MIRQKLWMLGGISCAFIQVQAQDTGGGFSSLKKEWYATTLIGASVPGNEFKKQARTGVYTGTGIEFQYMNHYWSRLSFENIIYPFESNRVEAGWLIKNKGSRFIAGLVLDAGYRYEFSHWSVYGFGGLGLSALVTPVSSISPGDNIISTTSKTRIYESFRAGIGTEWSFRQRFIPFMEILYAHYPRRTFINASRLSALNICLGFKARLNLFTKK
jgi:hypothetical protein